MNVLVAASEVVGFAKTGGLADVAGALPRALARRGHRCTIFLPLYRTVPEPVASAGGKLCVVNGPFYRNSRTRVADVTDGLSQTVLVGEGSSALTDKTWVGTCRQLDMTLSDGTPHSAIFQFTK